MSRVSLEELVTAAATRLMGADASSSIPATEGLLRELVEYFDVDAAFLRHHNHQRRTTTLVAEWPARPNIPDPDPLGVIHFETADPVFAATEDLNDVGIIRPDLESAQYQQRVREGSGIPAISTATVPLRSGEVTTGVLGFIKFGDRDWQPQEINTLKAIAALLTQLQARLKAERSLRYLAQHDELTGLANRRAMLAVLESRLVADQPGPAALLFLDIDRLKAMNDFLGHQAGDEFLAAVAARLRDRACPDDFVARLGGDEFVVVLAAPADVDAASSVAEHVQRVLNELMVLGGQTISRTVSIGVSIAHPGITEVSQWLGNADQAVLLAKAQGGNGIVVFTREMKEGNALRNDIELHLRAAIHEGSLVLHYQPEVDLRTGELTGAEALVRWHHPTLGLLQPDSFIGIAEATNLAAELGHWVINEACRQLAAWQYEIPELTLGLRVNVSPVQLIAVDFVDTVAAVLAEHGIDPHRLTLEITEHAVVSDLATVLVTLRGLRESGIQIAIDDFGTGYSSLAQLKTLPVNTLKIDKGFVLELGTNRDDLAIVSSIIGLATAFGLDIVAEGVETELGAQTLRDLGCVKAQGYLYSRPVPAPEMAALLKAGRIDPQR